jgi:hypothetical protein
MNHRKKKEEGETVFDVTGTRRPDHESDNSESVSITPRKPISVQMDMVASTCRMKVRMATSAVNLLVFWFVPVLIVLVQVK